MVFLFFILIRHADYDKTVPRISNTDSPKYCTFGSAQKIGAVQPFTFVDHGQNKDVSLLLCLPSPAVSLGSGSCSVLSCPVLPAAADTVVQAKGRQACALIQLSHKTSPSITAAYRRLFSATAPTAQHRLHRFFRPVVAMSGPPSASMPPPSSSSSGAIVPSQAPSGEALQQLLAQTQQRQAELLHHQQTNAVVAAAPTLPLATASSATVHPPPIPPAPASAVLPSSSSVPPPAVDPALQRLPIRAYLDQTVVPLLLDGACVRACVHAFGDGVLGLDCVCWCPKPVCAFHWFLRQCVVGLRDETSRSEMCAPTGLVYFPGGCHGRQHGLRRNYSLPLSLPSLSLSLSLSLSRSSYQSFIQFSSHELSIFRHLLFFLLLPFHCFVCLFCGVCEFL